MFISIITKSRPSNPILCHINLLVNITDSFWLKIWRVDSTLAMPWPALHILLVFCETAYSRIPPPCPPPSIIVCLLTYGALIGVRDLVRNWLISWRSNVLESVRLLYFGGRELTVSCSKLYLGCYSQFFVWIHIDSLKLAGFPRPAIISNHLWADSVFSLLFVIRIGSLVILFIWL
jgi:hypothetical protein